jgi:amino acid permease
MVILSLLFLNSNKRLQHMRVEVKKVKIILNILIPMLIMLIVIPIALATSLTMFMLLNFVGLPMLNPMLVTLSSWFIRIGKKK